MKFKISLLIALLMPLVGFGQITPPSAGGAPPFTVANSGTFLLNSGTYPIIKVDSFGGVDISGAVSSGTVTIFDGSLQGANPSAVLSFDTGPSVYWGSISSQLRSDGGITITGGIQINTDESYASDPVQWDSSGNATFQGTLNSVQGLQINGSTIVNSSAVWTGQIITSNLGGAGNVLGSLQADGSGNVSALISGSEVITGTLNAVTTSVSGTQAIAGAIIGMKVCVGYPASKPVTVSASGVVIASGTVRIDVVESGTASSVITGTYKYSLLPSP